MTRSQPSTVILPAGQVKFDGDLPVGHAFGHQRRHRLFLRREIGKGGSVLCRC
ncbi:MAG: hypothetical protein HXY41_00980 [Chloroflexi bacterium]|nr:hypothetical protein [Chloroflexota bacterium]